MCGENEKSFGARCARIGSPPRVRGKRFKLDISVSDARITPACAGKTPADAKRDGKNRDHPSVCGENSNGNGVNLWAGGSPPRVRGKHFGNGVFPLLILVLSLDPL